jgi:hypothetical protein
MRAFGPFAHRAQNSPTSSSLADEKRIHSFLLSTAAHDYRRSRPAAALYALGLFATAAMLIAVDYSPSDIANQASMLVLVLGAAALGLAAPRWAWLAALLLGATLAAAHAIYLAAGFPLPYKMSPAGWAGPASLLILIIPAGIAAYLGAGAAVLMRRHQ